jgi:hypothetical protein
MIRLIALVITLAAATSAQAMSVAPRHQADDMITQVRQGGGRCVTTSARRHVRRDVIRGR